MGHQGFDYSIWEKDLAQKQDKLKHSHRYELNKQKKRQEDDEWEEWDD